MRGPVGESHRRSGAAALRRGLGAIAMVAALVLGGCERNAPRKAALRYLENLHESNYAACYGMLSDQDRKDRTLAEFLTEIPLAPDVGPAWFHPVLRGVQFDPGDASRDGLHASVPVTITAPDLPLWERTLDASAARDRGGGQDAARSLQAEDYPKITYGDVIYLTREHRHWRVVADLAERDRIVDMHREAIVDYHQYDYAKVISAYQRMVADLDGLKATGAAGLATRYRTELAALKVVQAEIPAATAYAAKKVVLGDVAMRMSEERVPAIFGSITNAGDRALDGVQIAVTWYEGRAQNLKAEYIEKHPVVTTPLEFTDFSLPVLPFVAGEKRPFGFILTAPVQVQQDAAPYVTVSAIVFTHSNAPLPKLASANAPSKSVASAGTPQGVAVMKPPSAQTSVVTPSPVVPTPAAKNSTP
jgi:hypothetical protein